MPLVTSGAAEAAAGGPSSLADSPEPNSRIAEPPTVVRAPSGEVEATRADAPVGERPAPAAAAAAAAQSDGDEAEAEAAPTLRGLLPSPVGMHKALHLLLLARSDPESTFEPSDWLERALAESGETSPEMRAFLEEVVHDPRLGQVEKEPTCLRRAPDEGGDGHDEEDEEGCGCGIWGSLPLADVRNHALQRCAWRGGVHMVRALPPPPSPRPLPRPLTALDRFPPPLPSMCDSLLAGPVGRNARSARARCTRGACSTVRARRPRCCPPSRAALASALRDAPCPLRSRARPRRVHARCRPAVAARDDDAPTLRVQQASSARWRARKPLTTKRWSARRPPPRTSLRESAADIGRVATEVARTRDSAAGRMTASRRTTRCAGRTRRSIWSRPATTPSQSRRLRCALRTSGS